MPARFVIARNHDLDSNLPYLLHVPVDGGPLLLKAREPWPRTSAVYCHRADGWPDGAEVVDDVAAASCERRGRAIDLVLARGRENRSQFVFVTLKNGREGIFWQTSRTARRARPGVRIPARRASGWSELAIVADTRERYAYRFPRQDAIVEKRARPAGDYGVELEGRLVAAVERKSLPDLAKRLVDGDLGFLLAELTRVLTAPERRKGPRMGTSPALGNTSELADPRDNLGFLSSRIV